MIQLIALGLVGCVLIFAVWLDEELSSGTLGYWRK
jgi:hypothetical protein